MLQSEIVVNFDTIIAKVEGKLDQLESDEFVNEVLKKTSDTVKNVIIDMQNMDHLSSYGALALMNLHGKIKSKNGDFQIINIPESIRKILELLNFA